MCKTDKNARNDIISSVSLLLDKMCNGSLINWIYKNELIDFGGQKKTKYNRISFLVLLWLTLEKTTERKQRIRMQKSIWKQEIKLVLLRAKKFYYGQRDEIISGSIVF